MLDKQVKVGGIPVNVFASLEQASEAVIQSNGSVSKGSVIAINPEKVIAAQQNQTVLNSLMQATIRIPDGIGVKYVMQKKLKGKVARIAGCDLWETLMRRAAKLVVPVYIVGGTKDVNLQTVKMLSKQQTPVVGNTDGFFQDEEEVFANIARSGAKIVTVALGSPKQEAFIKKCQNVYPDALYMGVGGTYDVFTGNVKRAPLMVRKMGLEWLFRLLSQPTRWRRQLNLIKYIYLYTTGKL